MYKRTTIRNVYVTNAYTDLQYLSSSIIRSFVRLVTCNLFQRRYNLFDVSHQKRLYKYNNITYIVYMCLHAQTRMDA